MGKGRGVSMPNPGVTLPNFHVFTNPEALQIYSWAFMEASLHMHDQLNHWTLMSDSTSSSFPLPGGQG